MVPIRRIPPCPRATSARANGVTVPLATGGKLDFMYWAGTGDTIGVVFDVTGYFE
jgi:hypothetical protein